MSGYVDAVFKSFAKNPIFAKLFSEVSDDDARAIVKSAYDISQERGGSIGDVLREMMVRRSHSSPSADVVMEEEKEDNFDRSADPQHEVNNIPFRLSNVEVGAADPMQILPLVESIHGRVVKLCAASKKLQEQNFRLVVLLKVRVKDDELSEERWITVDLGLHRPHFCWCFSTGATPHPLGTVIGVGGTVWAPYRLSDVLSSAYGSWRWSRRRV